MEEGAQKAAREAPIKKLTVLPKCPASQRTQLNFLKMESLSFIFLLLPEEKTLAPCLKTSSALRRSLSEIFSLKNEPIKGENDFFFYGSPLKKSFFNNFLIR